MKRKMMLTLMIVMGLSSSFGLAACSPKEEEPSDVVVEEQVEEQKEEVEEQEEVKAEDEKTEADVKQPAQTTSPDSAKQQNSQTSAQPAQTPAPQQKTPTKADASAYIGKNASAMIGAIGAPNSSAYSPSCLGDGEDGELHYNGFTVYTYKEGGQETVQDVE